MLQPLIDEMRDLTSLYDSYVDYVNSFVSSAKTDMESKRFADFLEATMDEFENIASLAGSIKAAAQSKKLVDVDGIKILSRTLTSFIKDAQKSRIIIAQWRGHDRISFDKMLKYFGWILANAAPNTRYQSMSQISATSDSKNYEESKMIRNKTKNVDISEADEYGHLRKLMREVFTAVEVLSTFDGGPSLNVKMNKISDSVDVYGARNKGDLEDIVDEIKKEVRGIAVNVRVENGKKVVGVYMGKQESKLENKQEDTQEVLDIIAGYDAELSTKVINGGRTIIVFGAGSMPEAKEMASRFKSELKDADIKASTQVKMVDGNIAVLVKPVFGESIEHVQQYNESSNPLEDLKDDVLDAIEGIKGLDVKIVGNEVAVLGSKTKEDAQDVKEAIEEELDDIKVKIIKVSGKFIVSVSDPSMEESSKSRLTLIAERIKARRNGLSEGKKGKKELTTREALFQLNGRAAGMIGNIKSLSNFIGNIPLNDNSELSRSVQKMSGILNDVQSTLEQSAKPIVAQLLAYAKTLK